MSLLDAPLRWCAAWILESEIQIWISKPWSQTCDPLRYPNWMPEKKSWSVPLCGHCVTEHSRGCNWMSPKYLQSLCSCKGEPGHKRKSEFKFKWSSCHWCWEIQQRIEATIFFWNIFPNLPQPWFCHNPTNHIISSIYQQPFRKHVGAPASGSAPSLPWRVAAPVLLLILPQLDLHFPISAGLVSLQVFRASWLAT